jgi:large subunit ribosomal protein L23
MDIIIKPIITEKMSGMAEKFNRYGFVVHQQANKIQIKTAIEKLYGVTVEEVRTMRYVGKVKMRNTKGGINSGLVGNSKKAVISLKSGDTIDFYSNI